MKTTVIIALIGVSSLFSAVCEAACTAVPKSCGQPKKEGDDQCCGAKKIQMFYYNACSRKCEEFTYNGCHGNCNRFPQKCQCEEACVKNTTKNRPPGQKPSPNEQRPVEKTPPENCDGIPKSCRQPKKEGDNKCSGAQKSQMFYYNACSKRCEEFTYNGCHGNENRFPRKCRCEEVCVKNTTGNRPPGQKPPDKCRAVPDLCRLPKKEGDRKCRSARKRRMFYYNASSRKCEEFTFNGCHGNDNRFARKCQCEEACVKNAARNGPPAIMPPRKCPSPVGQRPVTKRPKMRRTTHKPGDKNRSHGERACKNTRRKRPPPKRELLNQKTKKPTSRCQQNGKLKK